MPYPDVLLGLRALFLTKTASPKERTALLSREAPALSASERTSLVALQSERLDVYIGLLRDSQRYMLRFVAPATFDAIVKFAGVPEAEVVRSTLVETPRRTHRMRELSQRLIDHLRGPGAAWVAKCPPLLDLARLEQSQTETFYAPDDEGALSPPDFAARVESSTVDEVLGLEWKPAAALRFVRIDFDVLDWRTKYFETNAWPDPPPRLAAPIEVVCSRDPGTLQSQWSRLEPNLLPLLKPAPREAGGSPDRESPDRESAAWEPLEALAGRWIEATGMDPDAPDACGHFLEQVAYWVLYGLVAVRAPVPRT